MRADARACANAHLCANQAVGANLDIVREFRACIDDGSRVNYGQRQLPEVPVAPAGAVAVAASSATAELVAV